MSSQDEIFQVIEDFESWLEGHRAVVLNRILVPYAEYADRVDDFKSRLRDALPPGVIRAEELTHEGDRILRGAREEAERMRREAEAERERILERARLDAEQLTRETAIIEEADRRAGELISKAEEAAALEKREADRYVVERFNQIQHLCERVLEVVGDGREELQVPDQT